MKQKIQESQYRLPYHYSDIFCEEQRTLWKIERRQLLLLVKDSLKPLNGQKILDAACGDGRMCYELKDQKVKLCGVDSSKEAINFARAFNPNVKFITSKLEKLKLVEKFDKIILMEAIEHFPPKILNLIMNNLKSLLKINGKIIITTPSTNLPLLPKHFEHFTKDSLKRFLGKYFAHVEIIGYWKNSWQRKIFIFLRQGSFIFYPLRKKIKIFDDAINFLSWYFQKYLLVGDPEECLGLLAICSN